MFPDRRREAPFADRPAGRPEAGAVQANADSGGRRRWDESPSMKRPPSPRACRLVSGRSGVRVPSSALRKSLLERWFGGLGLRRDVSEVGLNWFEDSGGRSRTLGETLGETLGGAGRAGYGSHGCPPHREPLGDLRRGVVDSLAVAILMSRLRDISVESDIGEPRGQLRSRLEPHSKDPSGPAWEGHPRARRKTFSAALQPSGRPHGLCRRASLPASERSLSAGVWSIAMSP